MRRYFCSLLGPSGAYYDASGFRAADDAEAIEVARAIARIIMDRDSSLSDSHMMLHDESGLIVVGDTLEAFASHLQ